MKMKASFTVDGGTLKALVNAYSVVSPEFFWLFTRERMEARALDVSHVSLLEFSVSPPDYECDVDRLWVYGDVEFLKKTARRFKKREDVKVEVKEGKFYVGPFEVGRVVEEEEVYEEQFKPAKITIRRDAELRLATAEFRRMVKRAEAERGAYENVGFRVGAGKATMLFFDEKESRVDVEGYEPWVLSIKGEGLSIYSLPLFSPILVLGLTDVVSLAFQDEGPLELTYEGDYFSLKFFLAPKVDEIVDRFKELLAKPKPVRKLLWLLRDGEVKSLEKTVRAIGVGFVTEKISLAMTEDLWLYWKEYDVGYLRISRAKFDEWHPPSERLSGAFDIARLMAWLKNVEDLSCFLEGEPAEAMVLVGRGKDIAPKEMRSEELLKEIDVPKVEGRKVFSGQSRILADVVTDAEEAEDAFLVFVSTPFEITAIGRDAVYYRAGLPLDAFEVVEEDYVAVNGRYFEALKGFFTRLPPARVTLGKRDSDIFIQSEGDLGELKGLVRQTAKEVEEAVEAYKEEFEKPRPTPPPEVKPLPPPVAPPPKPPAVPPPPKPPAVAPPPVKPPAVAPPVGVLGTCEVCGRPVLRGEPHTVIDGHWYHYEEWVEKGKPGWS